MDFLPTAGFVPLTRDNWELLMTYWKYFTLICPAQLILKDWYPMGKTSYESILNVPGKPAWILMELVSPLTMLYTVFTNPERTQPLSYIHLWLVTLYCLHYAHRALISPLMNHSMAPINIIIPIGAAFFNLMNGSLIGGWLGGYGSAKHVPMWQVIAGSVLFVTGLFGNVYHEEVLREIRRDKRVDKNVEKEGKVVVENGRVYKIPEGGLFRWVWHPHYFSEWAEWCGYMMIGGGFSSFRPAGLFVVNEVATMLPRALQGKRWYLNKFGKDAVPDRKAIIPGVI